MRENQTSSKQLTLDPFPPLYPFAVSVSVSSFRPLPVAHRLARGSQETIISLIRNLTRNIWLFFQIRYSPLCNVTLQFASTLLISETEGSGDSAFSNICYTFFMQSASSWGATSWRFIPPNPKKKWQRRVRFS